MTTITIASICDAIESTLAAAAGIVRSQSYNELTDDIPAGDTPLLQVYWENALTDDRSGEVDRTTFQAGIRRTALTFHADLYVRQRNHLGQDMALLVGMADAIYTVLEAQTTTLFGLTGIKAFRWQAQRVTFSYGNQEIAYAGIRWILTLYIF